MAMGMTFSAPWCRILKGMTVFSVCLLLGITLIGIRKGPLLKSSGIEIVWVLSMISLPLLMVLISPLFMIRGYILSRNVLYIKRLGWTSKILLENLQSIEIDPTIMKGTIRTFGNGGLFCFCGLYWKREVGTISVYITDFKDPVVLRFPKRTIVVSPEEPERFVAMVKQLRAMV
jgi:hypothetical protein